MLYKGARIPIKALINKNNITNFARKLFDLETNANIEIFIINIVNKPTKLYHSRYFPVLS